MPKMTYSFMRSLGNFLLGNPGWKVLLDELNLQEIDAKTSLLSEKECVEYGTMEYSKAW